MKTIKELEAEHLFWLNIRGEDIRCAKIEALKDVLGLIDEITIDNVLNPVQQGWNDVLRELKKRING